MSRIDDEDKRGLFARFWGFDRLIGSALIKIAYYIGLAAIVVGTLISLVVGLTQGEMAVAFAALIGLVVSVVLWRFFCELAVLSFQTYNRLGEIRDRLPETEAEWARLSGGTDGTARPAPVAPTV
jgi:hypothetical protein